MNDTPDRSTSPLVSRRTVAKTAAWAAPAIALAAASPAHAASPSTKPGFITFDQESYEFEPGGSQIIRGDIVPPIGETVPANFRLSNDFAIGGAGGFATLVSPILLADNKFELLVKGSRTNGATDTLKAYSTNHPAYVPGETALKVGGTLPTGKPEIVLDEPVFNGAPGDVMLVTGKIVMPNGEPVPTDLTLFGSSAVSGWNVLPPGVVIDGDTFSMVVTVPRELGIGQIMVGSAELGQAVFAYAVNVPPRS
jgi:hypothetical protein